MLSTVVMDSVLLQRYRSHIDQFVSFKVVAIPDSASVFGLNVLAFYLFMIALIYIVYRAARLAKRTDT